jgi:sterol desaturase/sphingolipid hydroxylase (fatty acid hydroxylase superfamily)
MMIINFLTWTFLLYVMHRVVHIVPCLQKNHYHHHAFIISKGNPGFHWSNLFLFNDDWSSTVDLWITEVIPTLLFCWLIDDYSLFLFYWLWASLLQETLEHKHDLNAYPLTMGQWHMNHHHNPKCNYGLFIPLWDKLFRTEARSYSGYYP